MWMEVVSALVGAGGVLVACLTWLLRRQQAHDARLAALVDDLEARTAALREDVIRAQTELRTALDYAILLRSALLDAGADPPPWPGGLSQR